jgi:hypothetical protein
MNPTQSRAFGALLGRRLTHPIIVRVKYGIISTKRFFPNFPSGSAPKNVIRNAIR